MSTDRLTFYADYACPFCFLGRRALSRYRSRRASALDVEWHPFDLRADRRGPDGTLEPRSAGAGDEETRRTVERRAASFGVEMARSLAPEIDSRNAQLASVHVQLERPDAWASFDEAIYDALWVADRDVGRPAVLADLAADVGLDPDEIEDALADPMIERRLADRFEAARIQGIDGVPTFVYGEHTVRGAVPPAQLRRLVEGV